MKESHFSSCIIVRTFSMAVSLKFDWHVHFILTDCPQSHCVGILITHWKFITTEVLDILIWLATQWVRVEKGKISEWMLINPGYPFGRIWIYLQTLTECPGRLALVITSLVSYKIQIWLHILTSVQSLWRHDRSGDESAGHCVHVQPASIHDYCSETVLPRHNVTSGSVHC